jgi:hypothetical protein
MIHNVSTSHWRWQTPCYTEKQVMKRAKKGKFVRAQMLLSGDARKVMMKQAPRKAGRPPGGENGQRVRDYPQVSIRVPPKLYAQLAALGRSTGLSRLEIFVRAIDCYEGQLRAQRRRQRRRVAA